LLFPCGEAGLVAATLPTNGAPPEAWNYDPASDARALRFRLENLPSPATCLAFTTDGGLCVTGHRDGSLRWWAGRTGQLLGAQPRSDSPVKEARFSPDGRFLVTRTFWPPGVVQTWQVATRQLLATNRFPNAAIFSFAFAPDGQRCAVGGQLLDFALWHTATLDLLGGFAEQRNPVHLLSWSPRGRTLASATLDGTLRLWHVPTGRLLATLWERAPGTHNRLEDLAFSADGQWLGACDSNCALHLWQASAPAEINP
jgi:WD40 repeat protein